MSGKRAKYLRKLTIKRFGCLVTKDGVNNCRFVKKVWKQYLSV